MESCDSLECLLHHLLAQQLTERIQNNAIADAEEKMERSRHDTLAVDCQQWSMIGITRMAVARSTIASSAKEIAGGDTADRTWMCGGCILETKHSIDKGPISIE